MRDRISLLKQQLQKELARSEEQGAEQETRRGLLARRSEMGKSKGSNDRQGATARLLNDYIKQIQQNKEEILNGRQD